MERLKIKKKLRHYKRKIKRIEDSSNAFIDTKTTQPFSDLRNLKHGSWAICLPHHCNTAGQQSCQFINAWNWKVGERMGPSGSFFHSFRNPMIPAHLASTDTNLLDLRQTNNNSAQKKSRRSKKRRKITNVAHEGCGDEQQSNIL